MMSEAEVRAIKAETVAGFGNEPPSRVYAARVLALCGDLLGERKENLNAVNAVMDTAATMGKDLAAALERERVLRATLEAVEWHTCELGMQARCPWCDAGERNGHNKDCQRQAALEGAKEQP